MGGFFKNNQAPPGENAPDVAGRLTKIEQRLQAIESHVASIKAGYKAELMLLLQEEKAQQAKLKEAVEKLTRVVNELDGMTP